MASSKPNTLDRTLLILAFVFTALGFGAFMLDRQRPDLTTPTVTYPAAPAGGSVGAASSFQESEAGAEANNHPAPPPETQTPYESNQTMDTTVVTPNGDMASNSIEAYPSP